MTSNNHARPGDIFISKPHRRGIIYLFNVVKQIRHTDVAEKDFIGSISCSIIDNGSPVMFIENTNLKIDDFISNARHEKENRLLMSKDVWRVLIGEKVYLAGFDHHDWSAFTKL
jgi:hypothetical protein